MTSSIARLQTSFTLAQLADPNIAEADNILRACVHCGFCTATCPTYVLLGDELDSPRGRIYLIKDMLENDRPATADVVKHIDRCLSCLACMTTCPSGVHYMHLVDHARAHIEKTYRRPLRRPLAAGVARPRAAEQWPLALGAAARLGSAKPFAGVVCPAFGLAPVAAMLRLAPCAAPGARPPRRARGVFPPTAPAPGRVALLTGCVSPVIAPSIHAAAIRVLTRHGIEVVVAGRGLLRLARPSHGPRARGALPPPAPRSMPGPRRSKGEGLDAILVTASGCGTTVKDYGFMLRTDRRLRREGRACLALAKDISEYLAGVDLASTARADRPRRRLSFGLLAAARSENCGAQPKELLSKMGFVVKDVPEGHLCCGSAGTYNILQPELARRLRERKVANIEKLKPDVIAAGNIGCITQIAAGTAIPVVHTVELIDWATGGPEPEALAGKRGASCGGDGAAVGAQCERDRSEGRNDREAIMAKKAKKAKSKTKKRKAGKKAAPARRRRSASRRRRAPRKRASRRKRSRRPRPPPRRRSPLRRPLTCPHPRGRRAAPPGEAAARGPRNAATDSDHVPVGSLAAE